MKRFYLAYLLLFPVILYGQSISENNVFLTYEEFVKDAPSAKPEFALSQWTNSDIFWNGRIDNYKITSEKDFEMLTYNAWGVKANGKVYVNNYPFSELKGYNEVLEKGYYTYFIGQPGWKKNVQRETGITKPNGSKKKVWGKVGYVVLPDGSVKVLKPKYLETLVADNQAVLSQVKADSLKQENVPEMFNYLKKYNSMK